MLIEASPSQSSNPIPSSEPRPICQLSEISVWKQNAPNEIRKPVNASSWRPRSSSAPEAANPAPTAIPDLPTLTVGAV